MKATLQSICGNSDVMDTEAVEKLCKYAEAAPEDEKVRYIYLCTISR